MFKAVIEDHNFLKLCIPVFSYITALLFPNAKPDSPSLKYRPFASYLVLNTFFLAIAFTYMKTARVCSETVLFAFVLVTDTELSFFWVKSVKPKFRVHAAT